jgi:hypothetical protein
MGDPPQEGANAPLAILCWVRTKVPEPGSTNKERRVFFEDRQLITILNAPDCTFKALKHQYSYPAPPHRVRERARRIARRPSPHSPPPSSSEAIYRAC